MSRRLAAVVLGLATACTAGDEPEVVYDPCSPLAIALGDASADEVLAVETAIAAWAAVLPVQVHVGDAGDAPVLTVAFVSDTAVRAIYWDSIGRIAISRELLEPEEYAIAVAHEMGHAFGLAHVSEEVRTSVMNVGNVTIAPTIEDADELRMRWVSCGAGE